MLFKCIYISKVESLVFNRIFITYIALFSLAFFVNLISVEMRGSFDFFFFLHFSLHPVYLQNLHTIYARLLQNCTIVKYILTTYLGKFNVCILDVVFQKIITFLELSVTFVYGLYPKIQ